jgi:hypothetical protein
VRLLTIVVVLVFALVGAGCGGDDESSADTDTVAVETTDETTTDETTTDETTTDETTTDDGSGGSLASGDCDDLISASAALGRAFSGVESNDLDESTEAFSTFADEAPEEIRADLELMARVYEEYFDAIQEAGLEPGETPSAEEALAFQQALASVDLQEFSAASQRFTTWAATNC